MSEIIHYSNHFLNCYGYGSATKVSLHTPLAVILFVIKIHFVMCAIHLNRISKRRFYTVFRALLIMTPNKKRGSKRAPCLRARPAATSRPQCS